MRSESSEKQYETEDNVEPPSARSLKDQKRKSLAVSTGVSDYFEGLRSGTGISGTSDQASDEKRIQWLQAEVNRMRMEWDKLKFDSSAEREHIKDHITSFESVVVNQVQTFSQHTAQIFTESKNEVTQEIEDRKKEAADILAVIKTMKDSVDRESHERMEQQERVIYDVESTWKRIEEVRNDFITRMSAQADSIDNMLSALDAVKRAFSKEQHERIAKYEELDYTLEKFLGIHAVMDNQLKEHQKDAKELLSMMNAMSKKQDLDAYERILQIDQMRTWINDTNEKVDSMRATQSGEKLLMLGQSPNSKPNGSDMGSRGNSPNPSRAASKEAPPLLNNWQLAEDGVDAPQSLTDISLQLAKEREARKEAMWNLESRCSELTTKVDGELARLEASSASLQDMPKVLEVRFEEILAKERMQWSQSDSGSSTGDVRRLEVRVSRLEAVLEGDHSRSEANASAPIPLSSRMDALAGELREALSSHSTRLSELAAQAQLAKQQLEQGEARSREAVEQSALAMEKRLLSVQQRSDLELESLRETVSKMHEHLADQTRGARETSRQLQKQAACVDEDRLLAVQQRFEEELNRRTSDLQRQLANIDSQLVGQREAEEQDGAARYAVLQQSLDTLIASIAAQQGAGGQDGVRELGQRETESLEHISLGGDSSLDDVDGPMRRVSKYEFNNQTQSLWDAVRQLQGHLQEQKGESPSSSSVSVSSDTGPRLGSPRGGSPLAGGIRQSSSRRLPNSAPATPTAVSYPLMSPPKNSFQRVASPMPRHPESPWRQRSSPSNSVAIPHLHVGRQAASPTPLSFSPSGSSSALTYAQHRTSQPSYLGTPRSTSRGLNTSPTVSVNFGQR